jgi:cytochrome oxidase Cu insertion factor (SCO1/SenC/PrrC family)
MKRKFIFTLGLLLAALCSEAPLLAAAASSTAQGWFSDRPLQSQQGETLQFYNDVLKDQVVLINFMFTHCETACPMSTQRLVQVQQQLQEQGVGQVRLVSISVDPERDTPQRLRQFAEQFGAGPDWLFLTGQKQDVDFVLSRLGQVTPNPEAHQTLYLLGNVKTGRWVKMLGFAPVEQIVDQLKDLAAEG